MLKLLTFKKIYNKYIEIIDNYKESNTDWYTARKKLNELLLELYIDVKVNKDFSFNNFVRLALINVIKEEYNQVNISIKNIESNKLFLYQQKAKKRFCPFCGQEMKVALTHESDNNVKMYCPCTSGTDLLQDIIGNDVNECIKKFDEEFGDIKIIG